MAVWDWPGRLWTFGRKLDALMNLQASTEAALLALEGRLRSLEDRMTRLEAGQDRVIAEAKAAATAAATMVAGAVMSDVVTRITRIEVRAEAAEHRTLPPPG